MKYYLDAFNKYADFSGRANRPEYWYFFLYNSLASFAALLFDAENLIIFYCYLFIAAVPTLSATCRRLHDTGRSGWWQLLNIIPFGFVVNIVFCIMPSDPQDNEYGPGPNPTKMKQNNQSRDSHQAPKAQPNAIRWIITAVAAIALMILLFALIQTQSNEEILSEESVMSKLKWSSPPAMMIDPQKQYTALIETELGNIKIRLFDNESPITVNNFVFLAQQGYYDGVIFHRVIHDFMVQGGDPTGTGSGGGPGYMFADEVENGLKFDRPGLLAMANSGPNTNGSQFFITHVATPHLNGLHTIYGEVVEGMSTVFAIPERNPQNAKDPGIIMKKVTISEE